MAVDYGTLKKGGFMRQKQKKNFSLRIAVVGGTLTAENLKKIAEVAEAHGEGYVHLTSRQGVEMESVCEGLMKRQRKMLFGDILFRKWMRRWRVHIVLVCWGPQIL